MHLLLRRRRITTLPLSSFRLWSQDTQAIRSLLKIEWSNAETPGCLESTVRQFRTY